MAEYDLRACRAPAGAPRFRDQQNSKGVLLCLEQRYQSYKNECASVHACARMRLAEGIRPCLWEPYDLATYDIVGATVVFPQLTRILQL